MIILIFVLCMIALVVGEKLILWLEAGGHEAAKQRAHRSTSPDALLEEQWWKAMAP